MYWLDFQILHSHWNLKIFEKSLSKSCSSWLYASFDTFWEWIDRLGHCTYHLNIRWNRHFDHFLSKMVYFVGFSRSSNINPSWTIWPIWTQKVSKEAWSHELQVFVWIFLENYNISAQSKAVKIRSVQCYVVNWIPFFWEGVYRANKLWVLL